MGEALRRAGNAAQALAAPAQRLLPLQRWACRALCARPAARLRRGQAGRQAASPLGVAGVSAWIPMAKARSSCRHINNSCRSRLCGERGSVLPGCLRDSLQTGGFCQGLDTSFKEYPPEWLLGD